MEEVCYIFSKNKQLYIFLPDDPKGEFKGKPLNRTQLKPQDNWIGL